MNKRIYSLALGLALLAAGYCGDASAESAHNAQTGAHTSNAYDTAETAIVKQNPDWKRLGFQKAWLMTPKAATEQSIGQANIDRTSAGLPADELERIQNEN